MAGKVYIVCEPASRVNGEIIRTVDLTPAAQWGEPVILLQTKQSKFSLDDTMEVLRERLSKFDDNDFLIPIGDPVLMAAASCVAAQMNNGRVKLLKWDRRLSLYFPVQMDLK